MPSIYDLKPAFQKLVRPVAGALVRSGVTANQITLAAVVLSFASGGAIVYWPGASWPLLALPLVLLIRMWFNALDGIVAREFNMKTQLGLILNEIGDVLSDAALYLPLALIDGISAPLIVAIVVLSTISEMTGVLGVQISGVRRYDGPMGKSDRAFVLGVLALLLGFGIDEYLVMNWILAAVGLLLFWTIINRARKALMDPSP